MVGFPESAESLVDDANYHYDSVSRNPHLCRAKLSLIAVYLCSVLVKSLHGSLIQKI